jgi:hypothetical protein
MRRVSNGGGFDVTAAAKAFLLSGNSFRQAHLFQIGAYGNPATIYATDWDTPLLWSVIGTFLPAAIKRSTITTKVGLDVSSTTVTWTPFNRTFTQSVGTGSPIQLAQLGYYDNVPITIYRVIMPTAGDANSYVYPLFGGRAADITVDRGQIVFTVNCWLELLNQSLPANVVESTNIPASYAGAQPPPGFTTIPQFNVFPGSTESTLLLSVQPPYPLNHIFAANVFQYGWLWFNYGVDATLGGMWAIVANNEEDPTHTFNEVDLLGGFPWPPTSGVDTCFISAPFPIDQADGGDYQGFPYVPNPQYGA